MLVAESKEDGPAAWSASPKTQQAKFQELERSEGQAWKSESRLTFLAPVALPQSAPPDLENPTPVFLAGLLGNTQSSETLPA